MYYPGVSPLTPGLVSEEGRYCERCFDHEEELRTVVRWQITRYVDTETIWLDLQKRMPSGMTAHLEIELEKSRDPQCVVAYPSLCIFSKRSQRQNNYNTFAITGRDGVVPLLWAIHRLETLNYVVSKVQEFRRAEELTVIIGGSDPRRQQAYERVLPRYGYWRERRDGLLMMVKHYPLGDLPATDECFERTHELYPDYDCD